MRAIILAAALLTACSPTPQSQTETLVGAWRLVSYTDTPEGGAPVQEFGDAPIGMFVFSADGHISVSMMRNPPADGSAISADPDACQPAWYCSYFGTYTVDWQRHEWTTHVEGGNIPSFIGSNQTRPFRIEGDTLTISTAYQDESGATVHAERVLERAS